MTSSESAPYLEVPQGEWRTLQQSGTIATFGIETCVAVSLYSPAQKLGFLGHFYDAEKQSVERQDMFDEVLKNLNLSNVFIWIGGARLIHPESKPEFPEETVNIANAATASLLFDIYNDLTTLPWQQATIKREPTLSFDEVTLDYLLDVGDGTHEVRYNH